METKNTASRVRDAAESALIPISPSLGSPVLFDIECDWSLNYLYFDRRGPSHRLQCTAYLSTPAGVLRQLEIGRSYAFAFRPTGGDFGATRYMVMVVTSVDWCPCGSPDCISEVCLDLDGNATQEWSDALSLQVTSTGERFRLTPLCVLEQVPPAPEVASVAEPERSFGAVSRFSDHYEDGSPVLPIRRHD